jgi:alpha-beta hydrolase superfamily lysophospholipase
MRKFIKYLFRTVLLLFLLINLVTAFHAYKFTHFYNPGEVEPTSRTHKSGWALSKDILFGINAVKRQNALVPDSALQVVKLPTSDGLEIEGWYLPATAPPKGTVVLFHGHGSTKSAVINEANAFRGMGYNSMLVDFRAHGNSSGNTCTIGYYESEEVKLAYDYIKAKGEKNIILWGISMGAAAISKAMNDYPLEPSRLILEMPFGSIMEAAGGRIKMMGLPAQPLAGFITFWGGVEHGFWAFNMNPDAFAKNIHTPTLLQWGRQDARVTQGETERIFDNLAAAKKLVVYENSGHQSLYKNEPKKWLGEVQHFLSH